MNDIFLYATFGLMACAIIYLLYKVRQPVEIRGTRERRDKDDPLDDLGEIGAILKELQPEIEKGLKLKDDQKASLSNWINTIDKTLNSKLVKWAIRRFAK